MSVASGRWRSVALPAEHGSWGFVLEPILLGLLVTPMWAGVWLALGAFGLFLLRWPFKVLLVSRRQRRMRRAALAGRFVGAYTAVSLLGWAFGIWLAGWQPLVPFLLALPFGLIFLWHDRQNQSRSWQAELAGPVAFGATAAAVAVAGGWAFGLALALWAGLIARAVPSVLYVRARLRLEKKRPFHPRLVWGTHTVALAVMMGFSWAGWLPSTAWIIFLLLAIRAAWGLSAYRRQVSVPLIGVAELGWGLLTVLALAGLFS